MINDFIPIHPYQTKVVVSDMAGLNGGKEVRAIVNIDIYPDRIVLIRAIGRISPSLLVVLTSDHHLATISTRLPDNMQYAYLPGVALVEHPRSSEEPPDFMMPAHVAAPA